MPALPGPTPQQQVYVTTLGLGHSVRPGCGGLEFSRSESGSVSVAASVGRAAVLLFGHCPAKLSSPNPALPKPPPQRGAAPQLSPAHLLGAWLGARHRGWENEGSQALPDPSPREAFLPPPSRSSFLPPCIPGSAHASRLPPMPATSTALLNQERSPNPFIVVTAIGL